MTIDKLIEKYTKPSILQLAGTNITVVETRNVIADLLGLREELMKEAVNIEYNHKVTIPKFVASWIKDENIKANGFDGILNDAIFSYQFHYIGDESIKDWIRRNPMKLKKALDYGYQVEEEPKYEVIINGKWLINMFSDRIAIRFVEKDELPNWGSAAYKLTEKEIKDIDKRYWPFAEPVEKEVSE